MTPSLSDARSPRAFVYQWRQDTWANRISTYTGRLVPYCASEQFKGAGIVAGDRIYVLGFGPQREDLLLIGRFEAASKLELIAAGESRHACLTEAEARAVLGDEVYGVPLYQAPWYLLPRPGTATFMQFDRVVPLDQPLRFGKPGAPPRELFVDPDGRVNQQAIRSVSRARPETIAVFERVLAS